MKFAEIFFINFPSDFKQACFLLVYISSVQYLNEAALYMSLYFHTFLFSWNLLSWVSRQSYSETKVNICKNNNFDRIAEIQTIFHSDINFQVLHWGELEKWHEIKYLYMRSFMHKSIKAYKILGKHTYKFRTKKNIYGNNMQKMEIIMSKK